MEPWHIVLGVRESWGQEEPFVLTTRDRRVAYAALTECGFERLKEVAPVHVASVRRQFLDGLDEQQMATLATVFCAIRQRLGVADLVNT